MSATSSAIFSGTSVLATVDGIHTGSDCVACRRRTSSAGGLFSIPGCVIRKCN